MKYGIWVHVEDPRPATRMVAAEKDGWMYGLDCRVLVFPSKGMAEEQLYVVQISRPKKSRFKYEVRPISDKEIAKENEGLP